MAKNDKSTGDERLSTIQSSLGKTERFFEKNQKTISYVLLGVIAVVAGIFAYNRFVLEPKEREAENQIFAAQFYFEQDSLALALNGDGKNLGFLDIADEYSGTASGNLAHYYIGIIYLKQGLYEDAIDELEQFDSDDEIISCMALGSIGDAYMELGNKEQALEYYMKAAENKKNDFTTPIYLMRAAWVNEDLGQWEEALKLYERIEKEHVRSFESREIKKYIQRAKMMAGL